LGFHLFAVVHELKGVEEFKPFFSGEVYLDAQVIPTLHLVVILNKHNCVLSNAGLLSALTDL